MAVKSTLTVSSTSGWERGHFIRCNGELFIIDRVASNTGLLVHKPNRLGIFWWRLVNRIKYRLRWLEYLPITGWRVK